jgi:hypothetical protein
MFLRNRPCYKQLLFQPRKYHAINKVNQEKLKSSGKSLQQTVSFKLCYLSSNSMKHILLQKLTIPQSGKNFPRCVEAEVELKCLQGSAISPSPEPNKLRSSAQPIFGYPFQCYSPINPQVFQVVSCPQISLSYTCMRLSL